MKRTLNKILFTVIFLYNCVGGSVSHTEKETGVDEGLFPTSTSEMGTLPNTSILQQQIANSWDNLNQSGDARSQILTAPIILVHGLSGFAKIGPIEYFVGVANYLKSYGYKVYTTKTDPFGSVETRGAQLQSQIESYLDSIGAEKAIIIAHSMGGLDARWMTSPQGGNSNRVAAVVTVGTPHRGTSFADWGLAVAPDVLETTINQILVTFDLSPSTNYQSMEAFRDLTTYSTLTFNKLYRNNPQTEYYSYGGYQNKFTGLNPAMWLPYDIIIRNEGKNDGLVPLTSAKWGHYLGDLKADHADEIGIFTFWDHKDFYHNIVKYVYSKYKTGSYKDNYSYYAQTNKLVINEFMANQRNGSEWVEIYNPNAYSINLAGYKIDDISTGGSTPVALPNVTIAGYGYYVFNLPNNILNNSGDSINLLTNASTLIDSISYQGSSKGVSIGRDQQQGYTFYNYVNPTPGSKNIIQINNSSTTRLVISEFLPAPITGSQEFIEIYNDGSEPVNLSGYKIDDISNGGSSAYTIPNGIVINDKSYIVFYAKITLNNGGDEIQLIDPNGNVVQSVTYNSSQSSKSYGVDDIISCIDNQTCNYLTLTNSSPGYDNSSNSMIAVGDVVINEAYAKPSSGEQEYIELYNTTNTAIDLSGYKIDDFLTSGSNRYILPNNSVIKANGYIIVTNSVILNNSGDEINLLTPSDTIIDSFSYTVASTGKVFARIPNGLNSWISTSEKTPGSSNTASNQVTEPVVTQLVYINEYYPNANSLLLEKEWIELYNSSSSSIDLSGYVIDDIRNGGSSPYIIPTGTTIAAGQYLILENIGVTLNNSGDSLFFLDPQGNTVDSHSYNSSIKGKSFTRTLGGFFILENPTKGSINF